ncbi:MAG: PQQ-binding-like beta-propeller repeat protein [Candidatus Bathyarchaeia archaeon]
MKKTALSIALALALIFAMISAVTPSVGAAGKSWPTFTFCSAAPNPVGVKQQVLLYVWLDKAPPTATGPWGDRWETLYIDITDPNGNTETFGPLKSDPIGFAYTFYTPTKVGVYKVQGRFEGQTLQGKNLAPGQTQGVTFIGDYYQPSKSDILELVVQEEALKPYPEAPLPTHYWKRPIDARYHSWSQISGNWMASPAVPYRLAKNTNGPETSHILWTKPLTLGGLVGGDFGAVSYYTGNAYEGKWWPPVIISGVLYYNKYPNSFAYSEVTGRMAYYRMPGVYAVDLRTGEELWYNPNIRIDFGQIYQYDSMNQHGAMAYLWQVEGTTYMCYDAWTGRWFYNITGVPSGTRVYGPKGEILIYVLNTARGWLALWDSSYIWQLTGAYETNTPPNGTAGQMWRPFNKVVDGKLGYVWNVTLPAGLTGSINYILPSGLVEGRATPEIILGSIFRTNYVGPGYVGINAPTSNFTVWCLNAKNGQLLWKQNYTAPLTGGTAGQTYSIVAASVEEKIFLVWSAQTRQYWAYSLNDGSYLWGPTAPQDAWDFTVGTNRIIAYGKVLSAGYGGILYCYDAKNGSLLWTYEAKDPYYLEAKWTGRYPLEIALVADRKVYVYSGEHSPDNPAERGAMLRCIDIDTGTELWKIPFYFSHWARNPAIADGIFVYMNAYDLRIYAFGKGPSATEVSASPKVVANGESVLIEGRVTDQSPGAKGTPAIADEYMDQWMEFLYMQAPAPENVKGVDVSLKAVTPDGKTVDIGTVTCDGDGRFSYLWKPPAEGTYTIMAIFDGSKSYWPSYAETAVGVTAAPPETATAEQAETMQSTLQSAIESLQPWNVVLMVLVAIAIVIGAANLYALRKRK